MAARTDVGSWVRIPASDTSFATGVRFLQALQYRRGSKIPQNDAQWKRIASLSQACRSLLQFEIHFPPRPRQTFLRKVQSFTIEGTTGEVSPVLRPDQDTVNLAIYADSKTTDPVANTPSPNVVTEIAEWRCDAVVVFTTEACRYQQAQYRNELDLASAGFEDRLDFGEVLHIQEYANGDAETTFARVLAFIGASGRDQTLIELPMHWQDYIENASATRVLYYDDVRNKNANEFGIWVYRKGTQPKLPDDRKQIQDGDKNPLTYATVPQQEQATPSFQEGSKDLQNAAEDLKRPILIAANYQGKNPQAAFDQDFQMIQSLPARWTREDEAQIKLAHENMLKFAKQHSTPTRWQMMAKTENVLSPLRLVSNSTAKDWYNDRLASEVPDQIEAMRAYVAVTNDPDAIAQQEQFEMNSYEAMNDAQRKVSVQWRASHVAVATDLDGLQPMAGEADLPKHTHAAMQTLRMKKWPEALSGLQKTIGDKVRTLAELQADKKTPPTAAILAKAKQDVDDALLQRSSAFQQFAQTEQAFQRLLVRAREANNKTMSAADFAQWMAESKQSETNMLNQIPPTTTPGAKLITQASFGQVANPNGVVLPTLPPPNTVNRGTGLINDEKTTLENEEKEKKAKLLQEAQKEFGIADAINDRIKQIMADLVAVDMRIPGYQAAVDGKNGCYQSSLALATQFSKLTSDTGTSAQAQEALDAFKENNKCLQAWFGTFQVFQTKRNELYKTQEQVDVQKQIVRMRRSVDQATTALEETKDYLSKFQVQSAIQIQQPRLQQMESLLAQLKSQFQAATTANLDLPNAKAVADAMEQTTRDVIKLRLTFNKDKEQDMEKAVVLHALQLSHMDIKQKKRDAETAAAVATEYLQKLQAAERAQKGLTERAIVLTDPLATVTINPLAIEDKSQTMMDTRRAALRVTMEHIRDSLKNNNVQGNLGTLLVRLREVENAAAQFNELQPLLAEAAALRVEANAYLQTPVGINYERPTAENKTEAKVAAVVEEKRNALEVLLDNIKANIESKNARGDLGKLLNQLDRVTALSREYEELEALLMEASDLKAQARRIMDAQDIESEEDDPNEYLDDEDPETHVEALDDALTELKEAIDEENVDDLADLLFHVEIAEANIEEDNIPTKTARRLKTLRAQAKSMIDKHTRASSKSMSGRRNSRSRR